jgi:hypothetical protein
MIPGADRIDVEDIGYAGLDDRRYEERSVYIYQIIQHIKAVLLPIP